MSYNTEEFINNLYEAIHDYVPRPPEGNLIKQKRAHLKRIMMLLKGIWDFILLLSLRGKISKNKISIYYTHLSFVQFRNSLCEDTLYGEILELDNLIFISYAKFDYLKKINGIRVYNIGIIVRILDKLGVIKKTTRQNNFNEWSCVNNFMTRKLKGNKIFIPTYSNEPGLSLVFNRYRKNYTLIEIQHGNVINYPPYSFIADRYLVDVFYCREYRSKSFLEENLFREFRPKLLVLNEKQVKFLPQTNRVEILYASSYEFSGFHPVFEEFLFSSPSNCHFKIRLHPRQIHLEDLFVEIINKSGVSYEIYKSRFWFDTIPLNTVVISPLSSIVEEAVNFGIKTVIIDTLGAKRFDYLIDNNLCFFSEKLTDFLNTGNDFPVSLD